MPCVGFQKFKDPLEVEKDMKFAIKSIVAATAFVAAGLASAAPVTVAAAGSGEFNGLSLTGTGQCTGLPIES